MTDFIYKIDHFVAKLFHNIYVWGGDFANHLMTGISFIAEAGILFLLIGLGLALFKRTRKIGASILFAVAIGFLLTNMLLKNTIERARPFTDISGSFYKWWLDAGATHESGYSFPSGHTTATTAFAFAIFLTTKKKYSWPILLFPILMASSRIYLMVHYFSDCLGGFVVGFTASVLACLLVKWIYSSKIKLFVWARDLQLFKSQKSNNKQISPAIPNETQSNDYVYTTQDEEISKDTDKNKASSSHTNTQDLDNNI